MAADDNLIRLCPVEVAAGFGELAEEVADVTMGALIQVLEVGVELNGGVSAEMRRWSEADLRYGIDKQERRLTRGEDGAVEECQRNPRRCACCRPFARER